MAIIAQTKRYLPHEISTKVQSVQLYRRTKDISFVCRRYHISKASLMRWNKLYDGTKASLYRALLTVTPDDVDNADDETRSTLIEMGTELLYIDEAYIIEKEDAEVFIFHHRIPAADEGKDKEFYEALIFDSDDKQRDVRVFCDDKDTALRIAATADIAT